MWRRRGSSGSATSICQWATTGSLVTAPCNWRGQCATYQGRSTSIATGKHRGPAAAVVAALCLDGQCSVEQAEAWLKRAGTDPRYTGLVGLPRLLVRPSTEELDRAAADFPEIAPVSDLARCMVEIDSRFDHLVLIAKAGWQQPADHPDLDPPHQALQFAEQYREASR